MPVAEDIQEGHFVRKRLDSVRSVASRVYHRVEGYSPLLKKSLQTIERSTAWISAPLVSKLSSVGPTVIDGLDQGLSRAYTTLDGRIIKPTQSNVAAVSERFQKAVGTQWFTDVNQQLKESVERTRSGFSSLYQASVDAYVQAEPTTFEEFVGGLRSRIAKWDEAYIPLAKQFWERAREAPHQARGELSKSLQSMRSSTLQAWDTTVSQISEKVNANELYRSSVEHYLTYTYKDEEGKARKVTVVELVDGMKQRLGSAWDQRLAKPLGELFHNVKAIATDDLKAMSRRSQQASESARSSIRGVRSSVQGFVSRRVDGVLQLSARSIDYLLPPHEEDDSQELELPDEATLTQLKEKVKNAVQEEGDGSEPKTVTFKSLAGSVSKRLRKRATVHLGQLRELSATRGKDIIHVDLIEYAEQCIDSAANKGKSAVSTTRDLAAAANPVPHVSKAVTAVKSKADPHIVALRKRAQLASDRVRKLTHRSLRVVGSRRVLEVHRDVYALCLKAVGLRERDAEFQQYMDESRGTIWAVISVLNVFDRADKQPQASSLEMTFLDDEDADAEEEEMAAHQFLRSAVDAHSEETSAQAKKLFTDASSTAKSTAKRLRKDVRGLSQDSA